MASVVEKGFGLKDKLIFVVGRSVGSVFGPLARVLGAKREEKRKGREMKEKDRTVIIEDMQRLSQGEEVGVTRNQLRKNSFEWVW